MARTPARRSAEQDRLLAALGEAAAAQEAAQAAYRAALLAAYDAGVTQAAIGEQVGISGESVRRYLARNRTD